jgi:hypothetical protein
MGNLANFLCDSTSEDYEQRKTIFHIIIVKALQYHYYRTSLVALTLALESTGILPEHQLDHLYITYN